MVDAVRSLRLAIGLFTILPVGDVEPDRRTVRGALLWAPVVGLALGLIAAVVLIGARTAAETFWTTPPPANPLGQLLAAAIAVISLTVLSGGLHLDGWADTVDGWASRGDKERTLTVMADPAVGAVGAFAVAADLLLSTVALGLAVNRGHGTEAIVVAAVVGRLAMVWSSTRVPARDTGMGAWAAGSVGVRAASLWTIATMAGAAGLALIDDDATRRATAIVLLAVPLALLVAALVTWPIRRRLGGVTGDVIGASCQVATTACLVIIACAPV